MMNSARDRLSTKKKKKTCPLGSTNTKVIKTACRCRGSFTGRYSVEDGGGRLGGGRWGGVGIISQYKQTTKVSAVLLGQRAPSKKSAPLFPRSPRPRGDRPLNEGPPSQQGLPCPSFRHCFNFLLSLQSNPRQLRGNRSLHDIGPVLFANLPFVRDAFETQHGYGQAVGSAAFCNYL